jgi:glycosyltransferase involved in cell wall biosynthesis
VTGVQTCALPISCPLFSPESGNIRTLELLLYRPEDFQVVILDLNYPHVKKAENEELFNTLKGVNRVTVNLYGYKIVSFFSRHQRMPLSTLFSLFVLPFAYSMTRIVDRKKLEFLKDQDVIYLFSNNQLRMIPRTNAFIVGTNHGFVYLRIPRSALRDTLTRLWARLELAGVMNRRIDGYHLFPGMAQLIGIVPRNTIELPLWLISSKYWAGRRTGKPKFLFAAQLIQGKGILTALRAWELSGLGKIATFDVCGWGPLAQYLKGAEIEGVIFHGFVSDDDLRKMYSECDVFIYPTRGDTFGFVVAEALSSGEHVLTSKLLKGLFDEFEQMGALEYLEDDVAVYAERMKWLANNIETVRRDAERVRKVAIEQYDAEKVSHRLFQYFRAMADLRKGKR